MIFRIKPSVSSEGNHLSNMAPIQEEIIQPEVSDNLASGIEELPADNVPEICLDEGQDKCVADVMDITAEFADLGVTGYEDRSQMNEAQDSEDIMAEIREIKRMIAEETDGGMLNVHHHWY